MAEQDKAQQTEEATPRKKEKLREEGKFARSADVGSAAVIAVVAMTLAATGDTTAKSIVAFAKRILQFRDQGQPLLALAAILPALTHALLPIFLASMVAAGAAGVAQTRGLFKLSLLAPDLKRLNPGPQLKKILPSPESGAEVLKQLLKLLAVAGVIYSLVHQSMPAFIGLASSEPLAGASTVAAVVARVAVYGAMAFAAVAAFDYWLALRKFREENKMSRRDVRDEHKREEGDPLIKRKRRQQQREFANRRAVSDVRQATVLVCNPTHISVALRYDPARDPAPVTLAKGVEGVALQMRARARSHRVPVVEHRPFARALYRDAEIGKTIPAPLYAAAAEVVAHVMRIGGPSSHGARS